MELDPYRTLLILSGLAAAAAALGVVPLIGRSGLAAAWVGWASAAAAGMMLGAAFMLSETRLPGSPLPTALGAVAGILFIHWTHRWAGVAGGELALLEPSDPRFAAKVELLASLHGASEGVAIGTALAVDLDFGIFLAAAIAVHNVPEGTVLATVERARGRGLVAAAGRAVAANAGQVALALAAYALLAAAPAALPWVVGFSVGTLVHLVLVELLPDAYRRAGTTPVALVATGAMGAMVLIERLLP